MKNIGFIGTGIMGKPMASNLQKAGYNILFSEQYKPAPQELLGDNGTAYETNKKMTQAADVIMLMLPDTPQVESTIFGESSVYDGLRDYHIVIDMSSISPIATKEFAKEINAKGADYLDAPVSGGEVGAINGSLTIMVGGSHDAFNIVKPLFESLGNNITLVGGNGDGQTCKIANQIIVALTIEAVSEALLFASKAGADPTKVREALLGGFASSKILEVHGERMVKGSFEPGFRISLHQKDLNLALSSARQMQLSLPNTATAQELFNSCAALDGSNWDHSAMIKALEHMANHKIRN
ncbi:MAG: 2-hydroxy-3-oxopropionate reductase [Desulfobulbia bacterium]